MIDHKAIIAAFRVQLGTVAGLPPDERISFDNVDFEKPEIDKQNPENSLWIREKYIPGNEEWVAKDLVEMVGIMEYAIFVPAGTSTEIADDLALKIRNVYKPSTPLGGILTVVRTDRLQGRKEDKKPWYFVPVRTSFRTTQNI